MEESGFNFSGLDKGAEIISEAKKSFSSEIRKQFDRRFPDSDIFHQVLRLNRMFVSETTPVTRANLEKVADLIKKWTDADVVDLLQHNFRSNALRLKIKRILRVFLYSSAEAERGASLLKFSNERCCNRASHQTVCSRSIIFQDAKKEGKPDFRALAAEWIGQGHHAAKKTPRTLKRREKSFLMKIEEDRLEQERRDEIREREAEEEQEVEQFAQEEKERIQNEEAVLAQEKKQQEIENTKKRHQEELRIFHQKQTAKKQAKTEQLQRLRAYGKQKGKIGYRKFSICNFQQIRNPRQRLTNLLHCALSESKRPGPEMRNRNSFDLKPTSSRLSISTNRRIRSPYVITDLVC